MRMLDIALKDLRQSFHSSIGVGMMFVVPLLITGLLYWAFGGVSTGTGVYDFPTLKVALANQDQPAGGLNMGRMLGDMFKDERMPKWLQVTPVVDEAAARAALQRREVGVAVIVPADLSATAASGGRASIAILQDPALSIGPAVLKDIVDLFLDGVQGTAIAAQVAADGSAGSAAGALDQGARQAMLSRYGDWYARLQSDLRHGSDPVITVQSASAAPDARAPADPMAGILSGTMAAMLSFFVFFGAANGAQSILHEQEQGTLARLFTTTASRSTVLGGKFLAVLLTVVVQALVLIVASHFAFGIDWGEPAKVALAVLGLTVVATGFGLMLISFLKSTRQAGPVIGGVLAATGMLGGLFTTAMEMPAGFQVFALAMPQGWAYRGFQLALHGASIGELALPLAVTLAMGAVFFAMGVGLFRRRFA